MSVQERASGAPVEALDVIVELLSGIDGGAAGDAFYSRLCEAVCRLASMQRAVIFRYDSARRRVYAAGAHGIELERFADLHVTVESVGIARRALEEDRVLDASGELEADIPPQWLELIQNLHLVFTPMAAAGRWIGVVVSERAAGAPPLDDGERHLLWTLGKTMALASFARIATSQRERARQLEQRIDLAREIHDGVVQRLFGVSLVLASAEPLGPQDQARAAEELQRALADLRTALQQPLGRVARETRVTLAEEIERLTVEHPDLGLVLEEGDPTAVPRHLEAVAQSVLTEAIRNAHKHASPSRVAVRVRHPDGNFVLEVVNDGVSERTPPGGTGMGLRLAAFEALQWGGVVEFGQRDPGAWQVRLVVPDAG